MANTEQIERRDDEPLSERVIIPMSKSMVARLRKYQFRHEIDSRSEVIRSIVIAALDADEKARNGI